MSFKSNGHIFGIVQETEIYISSSPLIFQF